MRVERTIPEAETWADIVAAPPPNIGEMARLRGEETEDGFVVSTEKGAAPAVDAILDDLPARSIRNLIAYAADLPWRQEVVGVVVAIGNEDVPVSTARGDDRAALRVAYSAIKNGLRADGATFNFAGGKPRRRISNADMELAVRAALDHVQTAFDLGETIYAAIEVGTRTTRQQIAAAFAEG